MTTHTTPLVSIERPSSNLTTVSIGPDLEFAFSYTTIVAFRAPTSPRGSWVKSRNVWSQATGKHLNQLPGEVIDHDAFNEYLQRAVTVLGLALQVIPPDIASSLPPVGDNGQGPNAIDRLDAQGFKLS